MTYTLLMMAVQRRLTELFVAVVVMRFRLRELMARSRTTSAELAEACEVSMSTVARWRASDVLPPIGQAQLERICEAVGCNPAELLDLE